MGRITEIVGVYIAIVLAAATAGAIIGIDPPSIAEPFVFGAVALAVGLFLVLVAVHWGTTVYRRWQRIRRDEYGRNAE